MFRLSNFFFVAFLLFSSLAKGQLYPSKESYDSAARLMSKKMPIHDSKQNVNSPNGVDNNNINSLKISYFRTTHIVSPEPIQYIDISSPFVDGDLPEKNIFRLRPNLNLVDGKTIGMQDHFTVTIVTKSFIIVYDLSFNINEKRNDNATNTAIVIMIDPSKAVQLNSYGKLTKPDFDRLSLHAMSSKRKIFNVHSNENGMEFWLNNVYVIGDLLLFDLGAKNHTNVGYSLNDIDFKLVDKYAVNATVSQEVELKPLYNFTYDAGNTIQGGWRNFYILKKFTYPAEKTLKIKMSEEQISGRPVELSVDYNQILSSKPLLN